MSQRKLHNAFHGLRFGLHDGGAAGIHGATVADMLHFLLLGFFKYDIIGLHEQMGKKTPTADEFNALAKEYGQLYKHQSDREKPKTAFNKGIFQGKIMAKEYTGVLLVALTALYSAKGREILRNNKKFFSKEKKHQHNPDFLLKDWCLLLETCLQWEEFMKLPEIPLKVVERCKTKFRYILYLHKLVLQRAKGMGMDCIKFHSVLHLAQWMIDFGVPLLVDTGCNEMHHKLPKAASKLTQKDERKFEKQTAQREEEFELCALAMFELETGLNIFDYLNIDLPRGPPTGNKEPNENADTEETTIRTTGSRIEVGRSPDGQPEWNIKGKDGGKYPWNVDIFSFLVEFQDFVAEQFNLVNYQLEIRTEHIRNGQIFRGTPDYQGDGPWHDWVMVDWGRNGGKLPAHILCFVNLEWLPEGQSFQFRESTVQKGIYALVNTAHYLENDLESEILKPIQKDLMPNYTDRKQLYLVDVEGFFSPVAVVPDIGSDNKFRYFLMVPRKEWSENFMRWLMQPHVNELKNMEEDEGKEEYLVPIRKAEEARKKAQEEARKKAAAEAKRQLPQKGPQQSNTKKRKT
jgi:hypothetical protein